MVCTPNDLSAWKDFPKGLRVLLVDEDSYAAAELKLKLQAMDYIVSIFCNENEALSAVLEKPENFHVAIVEVTVSNADGTFKFLETAKDLPTIMTSNIQSFSTMMKSIALGAVEFLRKPVSEDKLRNIWQHVVHKAFNAGGNVLSDSLKPVKESVVSLLHLQLEKNGKSNNETSENTENISLAQQNDNELIEVSDKYPAPSTPQLKHGGQLLDDVDCQGNTTYSTEKESEEQDGESKFVKTTFDNSITEVTVQHTQPQIPKETVIKEEHDLNDGSNTDCNKYSQLLDKENLKCSDNVVENPSKASSLHKSCGTKASRKKMKVDWTPKLHKKFVQAVEQLGVDQAIPSRILELMKVEGLTRHNVASHLQKYRMHRRPILPKEDDLRWPQSRDQLQRNYYPHKPIMVFPPHHSNHVLTPGPVYPVLGAPTNNPASVRMWGLPRYAPWQQMHADAWGCPVMPPPHCSSSSFPQNAHGFHSSGVVDNSYPMLKNSFDLYPAEETIDKVVKEAISKPWLPLPLGLKPPSAESVLTELSRQGITTIPPNHINGSYPC